MIVAIHQPQYLPWVPYFDKASQCDVFIHLDNVQFARRGVQNRNQIKTASGAQWLTVPVNARRETLIEEVMIAENPWKESHVRSVEVNYTRSAHFALWQEIRPILEQPWEKLVDLNIALTDWFFARLGIACRTVRASSLGVTGGKQDLMINLCKAVGGDVYLSGTGAAAYQTEDAFSREGIELRYQAYANQPYVQCFPEAGFVADLSALDLVLNAGPDAAAILAAGRKAAAAPSATL